MADDFEKKTALDWFQCLPFGNVWTCFIDIGGTWGKGVFTFAGFLSEQITSKYSYINVAYISKDLLKFPSTWNMFESYYIYIKILSYPTPWFFLRIPPQHWPFSPVDPGSPLTHWCRTFFWWESWVVASPCWHRLHMVYGPMEIWISRTGGPPEWTQDASLLVTSRMTLHVLRIPINLYYWGGYIQGIGMLTCGRSLTKDCTP